MYCFCFSSRRRHTRCALVTGVQTCALPICDRPLAAPWHEWSEETAGELAIVHAAADVRARLGEDAICQWIISMAQTLSDLLEVHVLAREAGLWRSGDAAGRSNLMEIGRAHV